MSYVNKMLFSKVQNEFFELTNEKPLICVDYDGKSIITASKNYLKFLEKKLDNV